MENGGVTMVCYRTFKPQGKVKRRVQDLRIPSSSYLDYIINRPPLDLSHNESTRLAVDSLLSQGLKGYHEMLNTEGEVDFLSALEKIYILKNGMDGCTGSDPDASDGKFESLSAYSESALTCPVTSTDSDKTLALSSQNGVKQTEDVRDEPNIEIYFQSGSRAASMKDLVRNFIRKATMALAIVMDCFSDVELLCDLLEACRKRNVSVHLLLDHLNLNLFVSMWQDLKLDGKNFPKLSVRSVVGHTYCAKTGRKLTGQIAESFIITDWTEALTGSYSFSWLSWQVHRSHAFLVRGSAVFPFHQEFHRLNSSSRPVPGFVTYISVPKNLPFSIYNTLQASQKDQNDHSTVKPSQTKQVWNENAQNIQTISMEPVSPEPWSPVSERSKDNTQYRHGRQTHNKPPQLHPKPLVHSEGLLGEPKQAVGAACTQRTTTTNAKPLEKIPNQKQSFLNPHSQTQVSSVQSDLSSLTITPAAEELPEPNPVHTAPPAYRQHRSPCFKTFMNPEQSDSGSERLFFQQRKRDGLFKAPGTAAGTNTQRQDWYTPTKFKSKVGFQSNHSHVLSPSTPWKKEVKTGLISLLTQAKDHILRPQTKVSRLAPRMQDQPDRYTQPPFQSHQTREASGPKSALTVRSRQFQPGSMLLAPNARAKQHPLFQAKQEVKQTERPNWTPQGHNERSRSATRYSSLRSTYEAGQPTGCKPAHTSLRRSLSMTDRRATRYK